MSAATCLDPKVFESIAAEFTASAASRIARNSLTSGDLLDAIQDRDVKNSLNYVFSHKLAKESKVSSQKSSGRCWMFAAFNVMRLPMMKRLNLPSDFEISQSYLFFFDKIERVNYFLEQIIDTRELDVDARVVQHLLTTPVNDGGQYDMLSDLIAKYGLVPKSVFPETFCSSASLRMNRLITTKLRDFACELRAAAAGGADVAALRELKSAQVAIVYRILLVFFGVPPTTFDWTYVDEKGKYNAVAGLTPLRFFNEYVQFPLSRQVSVIHDPRHPYNKSYTVERLGNVVGGQRGRIKYLNLPIDELKTYAMRMINAGMPVWFGCDVGKEFHRKLAVMDTSLFDYASYFGADAVPKMCKKDRLLYGQSLMTHAMVFTGYDVDPAVAEGVVEKRRAADEKEAAKVKAAAAAAAASDSSGGADDGDAAAAASVDELLPVSALRKWRVENSWGSDNAPDKGYYVMTDAWFSEYMFQLLVDNAFLSEEHQAQYDTEPTLLKPWDPMGALAHAM